MDAAILTKALNSPELFQSVVEHFPAELIEAELALLPRYQQLRFSELREQLIVQELAYKVEKLTTWEEIEQVLAEAWHLKEKIWLLLSDEQKERIKALKAASAKPIDPKSECLNGLRVFVPPGPYCCSGEGVVEVDRGFGLLRVLEVRMKWGGIQVVLLTQVRSLD